MTAGTVAEVVRHDLCIGCGLCEAVTAGRVQMAMTAAGTLRPHPLDGFRADEEARILAACPGVVASPREEPGVPVDDVWGAVSEAFVAWAADPGVRFRSASGGVLTALGMHLLRSGGAHSVLHVAADQALPIRSRWVLSTAPEQVLDRAGSRYGPVAPLAGLGEVLDRGEPFAVIAKPCDLGALHRYEAVDERVGRLCVARLALVCGGQSRLTKTRALLDELGVAEQEVASLRYRGDGNPGPTRVVTTAGAVHDVTYLDMWADEAGWDVETRCKLCPDALGEAADVAVADAWPGGAPIGEDEGYNAVVVRTGTGRALIVEAIAAGELIRGEALGPRQLDDLQPHQVRKKVALAARYEGLVRSGIDPIETGGLRVRRLGQRLAPEEWQRELEGTRRRLEEARS